jgi:hypothetical protein
MTGDPEGATALLMRVQLFWNVTPRESSSVVDSSEEHFTFIYRVKVSEKNKTDKFISVFDTKVCGSNTQI